VHSKRHALEAQCRQVTVGAARVSRSPHADRREVFRADPAQLSRHQGAHDSADTAQMEMDQ